MLNISLLIFLFLVSLVLMSMTNTLSSTKGLALMIFTILVILALFINSKYEKPLEYE